MDNKLKELVIKEYDSDFAKKSYEKIIKEGLFESEKYFIGKYFKKKEKVLDIGCGTGRASIQLHKLGYKMTGIDIVKSMIEKAKEIAKRNKLKIKYKVGDATSLQFKDKEFDYALFTYQGWTKIPGKENRQKALNEAFRVLKKGGIFLLTARRRIWTGRHLFIWLWNWIRFYILKRIGFKIWEKDFGDRMWIDKGFIKWLKSRILKSIGFKIEDNYARYNTNQYYHIPSVEEVKRQIRASGFKILEINNRIERQKWQKANKHSPLFYVCEKI